MAVAPSPQRRYFDQSYVQEPNQLEVFFQLSKTELVALYFSPSDNRFVGFEEFSLGDNETWSLCADPLREVVTNLPKSYKKVSLSISTSTTTLVPSALFDKTQMVDYLELNHGSKLKSTDVDHKQIEDLQLVSVFEIPFLIKNIFLAHFNLTDVVDEGSVVLEYLSLQKPYNDNQVHVFIQQDYYILAYFNESGLVFLNRFEFQTNEDFMYFLLYVLEQLKLDREKLELLIYGNIDIQTGLKEMLEKYIAKIDIRARDKKIEEAQVLSQLHKSEQFNLFKQYLCES